MYRTSEAFYYSGLRSVCALPEGVEDHGEEHELAEQRHDERGGRDDLGQQQEEHGEREQDGDGQRHLLTAVGGQVEHEHGEEGDAHARDDEVHRVEQRLAPHRDIERDVQVRLVAARVELFVSDHIIQLFIHQSKFSKESA